MDPTSTGFEQAVAEGDGTNLDAGSHGTLSEEGTYCRYRSWN